VIPVEQKRIENIYLDVTRSSSGAGLRVFEISGFRKTADQNRIALKKSDVTPQGSKIKDASCYKMPLMKWENFKGFHPIPLPYAGAL
jgi:hypothetical protein